ncbi:MAG: hypothetical protein OXT67_01800 [Zetaproteobacteria bacterium]|nr:hypothetical protein [Zetaproteobacteria bacterium]
MKFSPCKHSAYAIVHSLLLCFTLTSPITYGQDPYLLEDIGAVRVNSEIAVLDISNAVAEINEYDGPLSDRDVDLCFEHRRDDYLAYVTGQEWAVQYPSNFGKGILDGILEANGNHMETKRAFVPHIQAFHALHHLVNPSCPDKANCTTCMQVAQLTNRVGDQARSKISLLIRHNPASAFVRTLTQREKRKVYGVEFEIANNIGHTVGLTLIPTANIQHFDTQMIRIFPAKQTLEVKITDKQIIRNKSAKFETKRSPFTKRYFRKINRHNPLLKKIERMANKAMMVNNGDLDSICKDSKTEVYLSEKPLAIAYVRHLEGAQDLAHVAILSTPEMARVKDLANKPIPWDDNSNSNKMIHDHFSETQQRQITDLSGEYAKYMLSGRAFRESSRY